MSTFFALFNKNGIACAADSNHTIYQLHKDLPVALAVNPESQIPWDEIIREYKRNVNTQQPPVIQQYAFEFDQFLSGKDKWKNFPTADSDIMFIGYGQYEIFPSVYHTTAIVKEDGRLGLKTDKTTVEDLCPDSRQVTYEDPVFLECQGNFESVAALLTGRTEESCKLFYNRQMALWEEFRVRALQKARGTEYEEYVKEHLAAYPYDKAVKSSIRIADENTQKELVNGISSFSVEDMVTAVETIVNVNAKLNRLKGGKHLKPVDVREIAVLTIPEGLTWIKHSLYLRREEI